jgi:hypothetical protein
LVYSEKSVKDVEIGLKPFKSRRLNSPWLVAELAEVKPGVIDYQTIKGLY